MCRLLVIFKSLETVDIDAKMLVQRKFGTNSNVYGISDTFTSNLLTNKRIYVDLLPMYLFTKRQLGRFSFAREGINISKINLIQEADIIHFHWINEGFLSLKSISQLINLKKPIFWTLHDMWAFTGRCHYAGICEKYKNVCNACPFLIYPNRKNFHLKSGQ